MEATDAAAAMQNSILAQELRQLLAPPIDTTRIARILYSMMPAIGAAKQSRHHDRRMARLMKDKARYRF